MAKTERQKKKERDEFEKHVRLSTDEELAVMIEIADMQKQHPDCANRCWAGSSHNIPFLIVLSILDAEKKRRGLDV